jgi:hypothetical protein
MTALCVLLMVASAALLALLQFRPEPVRVWIARDNARLRAKGLLNAPMEALLLKLESGWVMKLALGGVFVLSALTLLKRLGWLGRIWA